MPSIAPSNNPSLAPTDGCHDAYGSGIEGDEQSRVFYYDAQVTAPAECSGLTLTRFCLNSQWSDWAGKNELMFEKTFASENKG